MPVVYSRKRLRAEQPPPSPPTTPSPPPSPCLRPPPKRRKLVQLHLDAGQSDISASSCRVCGMVYTPGAAGDDAVHRKHHAAYLRRRYPTLKVSRSMRVLAETHEGKYVSVRSGDAAGVRGMRSVDDFVRERLGGGGVAFGEGWRGGESWMAVAYVVAGAVWGYLYAERVERAEKARVEGEGVAVSEGRAVGRVFCGVRRVWVKDEVRRKGIASRMIELVRTHLVYGHVLERGDVAFTAPTAEGGFLARAVGGETVLVYVE